MNLLITQGLGSAGDGSGSGLLVTAGLGSSGTPDNPACMALQVLAVQNFGTYLLVTFSNNLVVSGPGLNPSTYAFTGPTVIHATLIEVVSPGHLMKIYITEQQTGGDYTVTLPSQGIMDTLGNVINGPFTSHFVGIGVPTVVQIAKGIDERTLDIVFSEAVMQADAEIAANYSISPTLAVISAHRVTDFNYRLVTGPQVINQVYQVDISNIRDINGNL